MLYEVITLGELFTQILDILAFLADNNAGARGMHGNVHALCRPLDNDLAHRRMR